VTVFAATWCYVLLAWVLLELGLKAWRAPCRIVGLPAGPMAGTLPVRIEPGEVSWQAAAGPPEPGLVPCVSPTGEAFWSTMELAVVVDPVHVGATEEWSPVDEVTAVETDTFTEADILSGFDRIIADLHAEPDWLAAFRADSFASPIRRAWALESTGGYTMREAALVEALVLAAA
jgi:hypothetical protein